MILSFASELWIALLETLEMVSLAGIISTILGVILGLLLNSLSPKGGIIGNKYVYAIVGFIINMIRSIPFLILGVLLIPLTMWITSIFGRATFFGALASCVPLTIASTAFIAKVVESACSEVIPSMIEAGLSLGLSRFQIVTKIILKEALPSIINGISLALISLLGISAVVVAWSGGGLGSLAKIIGVDNGDRVLMLVIVAVIILLVLIIQFGGNILYKLVKFGRNFKLSYVTIPLAIIPIILIVIFNIDFSKEKQTIVIGGMSNPSQHVIQNIKSDFESYGYNLEIEIFSEFKLGNPALYEKAVDATLFQHTPYLNNYLATNPDADFTVAAEVYYPLFGGYSNTISDISQLKTGSVVAIPNDLSNGVRALSLLVNAGVIYVDIPADLTGVTLNGLISKISYNKQIKIELAEDSNVASSAKNGASDLGICSYTFASAAGFDVRNDCVVQESLEMKKTNVNILVVRTEDKDEPWVSLLSGLLTNEKTEDFINDYFEGAMLPLFTDYINGDGNLNSNVIYYFKKEENLF